VSVETVRAWIDAGPCSAAAALERGAIHGLAYTDELREKLGAESTPPGRARLGPFAAALATHPVPNEWVPVRRPRREVVVLDVTGTIMPGKSRESRGSRTAGSESLIPALHGLRRDSSVKAVVLRISSPGGSALASDLIWHAAKRLAKEKPVIAYFDDVAASGGYYIGAAARSIVASPTCVTGSIGVFLARPDLTGTFDKLDVDHVFQARGTHAGAMRTDVPLSEPDRAVLQRDVDETYEDFLKVVAEGRGKAVDEVRPHAGGRVWLAPRAVELGLVDRLGTLEDAIGLAIEAAKIEGPVRVLELDVAETGWRALVARVREGSTGLEARLGSFVGALVVDWLLSRFAPKLAPTAARAEWIGLHPLVAEGRAGGSEV